MIIFMAMGIVLVYTVHAAVRMQSQNYPEISEIF